jgi:hypothetical protein
MTPRRSSVQLLYFVAQHNSSVNFQRNLIAPAENRQNRLRTFSSRRTSPLFTLTQPATPSIRIARYASPHRISRLVTPVQRPAPARRSFARYRDSGWRWGGPLRLLPESPLSKAYERVLCCHVTAALVDSGRCLPPSLSLDSTLRRYHRPPPPTATLRDNTHAPTTSMFNSSCIRPPMETAVAALLQLDRFIQDSRHARSLSLAV